MYLSDGSVPLVSNFTNPNDFEGWTCGKITKCGKFGNLCGGALVKGYAQDIRKTFNLPAGTYALTLDFIKIDDWLVRVRFVGCHHGVVLV